MIKPMVACVALLLVATPAGAQTPHKGGGPIDYSKPNRLDDGGRGNYLSSFSGSSSGLGNELSGHYAPSTFGAVTFGGGGTRCSGLFRSRSC